MNRESKPLSPYYRSLTRNMVLLVMVISLTPMLLVTGIILKQFSASHHEKIMPTWENWFLSTNRTSTAFLEERLQNIRFLADTIDFDRCGQGNLVDGHLARLQRAYGPVFVDLGVVDEQGQQVAYAGPFRLEKARYADADWFKRAIESRYYTSDVFLGLRGAPHFILSVRKTCQGQKWIIRATIDFVEFNRLVEKIRIGETGFAYILNRDGSVPDQTIVRFYPGP
jgi:two-component system NtrC family sensor kinase